MASVEYLLDSVGVEKEDQPPLLDEIVDLKDAAYAEIFEEYGEPLPGAVDFANKLAAQIGKENMAIASSAMRKDIDRFFKKSGLDSIFKPSNIVSNEDTSTSKPDPQAFNLAFERLDLGEQYREHVIAFEDAPKGIESAKRAGMTVFALTTRFPREVIEAHHVQPDVLVDSYAEMSDVFGF